MLPGNEKARKRKFDINDVAGSEEHNFLAFSERVKFVWRPLVAKLVCEFFRFALAIHVRTADAIEDNAGYLQFCRDEVLARKQIGLDPVEKRPWPTSRFRLTSRHQQQQNKGGANSRC